MAAADDDFGSGADHGAGSGSLFAGGAVAHYLNFEVCATRLLDDLTNCEANERGNAHGVAVSNDDGTEVRGEGRWLLLMPMLWKKGRGPKGLVMRACVGGSGR